MFDPKWHATDAQLTADIELGVGDSIQLLQYLGIDTNLSTRNGFFHHPWKHFPLKDTYRAQMAEMGGKEDDPTEPGQSLMSPSEDTNRTLIITM